MTTHDTNPGCLESATATLPKSAPESAAQALYRTLSDAQKRCICFDWDHEHPVRGLLRAYAFNFWHVTNPMIGDDFYSPEQRALLFEVFTGLFNPDWHERILRQLRDDHDGAPWGHYISCGVFGEPDSGRFQLVLTGRHLTIRVDGEGDSRLAFGGPIVHGHAPGGSFERVNHPGNVFWHQARLASKVYTLLDGKQQQQALLAQLPQENAIGFRGPGSARPGLPCSEMTRDQKEGVEKVLLSLVEPYRKEDQDRVRACLAKQGGLVQCSLAFYKGREIGLGSAWENWRLEGPAFVWYFRGSPHVHIWIHVADDPAITQAARASPER